MKISVVIPIFNQEDDVASFVERVRAKLEEYTREYNIILSTAEDVNFVECLHSRLGEDVDLVAVRETDDYQQIVMAGVEKADGDANIIMTPDYDVDLIDTMIVDWQNGKKIVCLRKKHNKFGHFFSKMRLKIYNLFLLLFGDIFSIGILKNAQLLDREIVDKMKAEQDMAHRFRTMYAPLDYNTSVHDIEHPIERFERKGSHQFDFWLGCAGVIITLLAFVTGIILAISLKAPIWVWTLFIVFGIVFEFLFVALLVNAVAREKIGILHNMDENGRIYNLVQDYHGDNVINSETKVANNAKTKIKPAKVKKTSVVVDENQTEDSENVEVLEEKKTTKSRKTTKRTSSVKNNVDLVENDIKDSDNEKKLDEVSEENLEEVGEENQVSDIAVNDDTQTKKATKSTTKKSTAKKTATKKSAKMQELSNVENANLQSDNADTTNVDGVNTEVNATNESAEDAIIVEEKPKKRTAKTTATAEKKTASAKKSTAKSATASEEKVTKRTTKKAENIAESESEKPKTATKKTSASSKDTKSTGEKATAEKKSSVNKDAKTKSSEKAKKSTKAESGATTKTKSISTSAKTKTAGSKTTKSTAGTKTKTKSTSAVSKSTKATAGKSATASAKKTTKSTESVKKTANNDNE